VTGVRSPRLLAAFVWLRWRALVHGLRGRRRGGAARVGAWLELAASLPLAALTVVGSLLLAWGAWNAGRRLAGGDPGGVAVAALRVAAAIVTVVLAFLSLLSGGRGTAAGWTRMLLLPVSRAELHALALLSGFADPWLLATVLPLATLAVALAPAGAAALPVAAAAGALLFTVIGMLGTWLSFLVQLLFRDRRRAELVVLAAFLTMMAFSLVPQVVDQWARGARRSRPAAPALSTDGATRDRPPERSPEDSGTRSQERPDEVSVAAGWLALIPSEAFAGAVGAARSRPLAALPPLAALAAEAALLYALSRAAWRRLVETPATGSQRSRRLALPRLASPGSLLGHPALAVARVQVAVTLRTIVGRIGVVTPVLMVVTTAAVADATRGPIARLAPLLGATAVLALGPLSMFVFHNILLNQFGADGAGLSLQVLSPLDERAIVAGKALGGAALTAVALAPAMVAAAIFHPRTPALLWPATVVAATAAYLLFAPAALMLSLLFAKAVDLGHMGSKGKPHAAASLGGMAVVAIVLACVQLVAFVGLRLGGPAGALVAESMLAVLAAAFSLPALVLVARALPARREAVLLAIRSA